MKINTEQKSIDALTQEGGEKVTRNILLVDDEKNIIQALKRLLRKEGYMIYTANSGAEGLAVLEQQAIGVILSDQRMPEMTGSEFLGVVKSKHPETVRIVLSGYTDLQSVTDAINKGAIYKFFTKPWDDDLLKQQIKEAFEHYELKEENKRLTVKLAEANRCLSKRVEKKSHEAQLNNRALRFSQELLDNLPFQIIGLSSDLTIMLANDCAAADLLSGCGIVGVHAKTALPHDVFNIIDSCRHKNEVQQLIQFNEKQYHCLCKKLPESNGSDSKYLLMLYNG